MANIIAEIRITLTDQNEVGVTGQLPSQIVALGLLELAKDAIREGVNQQRIAPADAAALALVGGKH